MRLVAYIGQANRASARAMHGRFTRRRRPERPHHACVTPATISFGGNYIPKGNVVATLSSRSHARDMLLSCFPSQVRLLGQNFTGHVHGTGRDKAARYPVKLTMCETIRTFLQPEQPFDRRIRIWHESYTGQENDGTSEPTFGKSKGYGRNGRFAYDFICKPTDFPHPSREEPPPRQYTRGF